MYLKKTSAVPNNDKEFAILLNRFTSNIPNGYCGITEEDLAPTLAATEEFSNSIIKADDAVVLSKEVTSEKKANRQRLEQIFRPLIRRMKAHPGYTQALGFKLGIEGKTVTAPDLSNATPSLTAIDKTDGIVELGFVRRDGEGATIYVKRDQATEWTLVGRVISPPFLDVRPLLVPDKPEMRRYTAVYMRGEKEVGHYNDDVVVTCTP